MNPTIAYCEELQTLLHTDPERFGECLRRRWAGQDGPALAQDRSWNTALFRAYDTTPDDLRPQWAGVLCDLLDTFTTQRVLNLGFEERLHLLGALEPVQGVDWPELEATRLRSHLIGWFELGKSPPFPPPRDLWYEDRFAGQPEIDLMALVLRLAATHLEWSGYAEVHWKLAMANPQGLSEDVVSKRLWEIARWAIATAQLPWLGERLESLIEKLDKAPNAPGNLTQLFFLTELDHGARKVVDLIVATPEPVSHARRERLAQQLDYFGMEEPALRQRLWRMRIDPAAPIPKLEEPDAMRLDLSWTSGGELPPAAWQKRTVPVH